LGMRMLRFMTAKSIRVTYRQRTLKAAERRVAEGPPLRSDGYVQQQRCR
jgi:hypothetical protein